MTPPTPLARLAPVLLPLLLSLATACTHTLEIRNRDAFTASAHTERSMRIAIVCDVASGQSGLALAEAVREGLSSHASVERAVFADLAPEDFTPDYVVKVDTETEYDGSGLNYWITFPGFLVFAHAWNGLAYEADVRTLLSLQHLSAESPETRQLETKYDLRHTTFLRGALVSSGWYTPFYGGINLILGFFMLPYDDSATEPFLVEVQDPYGSYVANHVIEMIEGQEIVRAKLRVKDLAETPDAVADTVAEGSAEVAPEAPGSVSAPPPEVEPDRVGPEAPAVAPEPEAQPSS